MVSARRIRNSPIRKLSCPCGELRLEIEVLLGGQCGYPDWWRIALVRFGVFGACFGFPNAGARKGCGNGCKYEGSMEEVLKVVGVDDHGLVDNVWCKLVGSQWEMLIS